MPDVLGLRGDIKTSETPLKLNGTWDEGELILSPSGSFPPEVKIHNNHIITPNFTFVIQLEQPA